MATMKHWTDEELGLIQSTMEHPLAEVAALLSRTYASVSTARTRLKRGWTGPNKRVWTEEEDAVIREHLGNRPSDQIAKLLPGRSRDAVKIRSRKLGLPRVNPGDVFNPHKVGSRILLAKTCIKCGYLMPENKFGRRHGEREGVTSLCRFCESDYCLDWSARNGRTKKTPKQNAANRDWAKKAQEVTQLTATRNGYPYLESDFEVIDDPNLTVLGKALKLDRTYVAAGHACRSRGAKSRGLVRKRDRAKSSWTIDNPNLDNVDDITAMLKEEFAEAGVKFPVWDWDDEDLD